MRETDTADTVLAVVMGLVVLWGVVTTVVIAVLEGVR